MKSHSTYTLSLVIFDGILTIEALNSGNGNKNKIELKILSKMENSAFILKESEKKHIHNALDLLLDM